MSWEEAGFITYTADSHQGDQHVLDSCRPYKHIPFINMSLYNFYSNRIPKFCQRSKKQPTCLMQTKQKCRGTKGLPSGARGCVWDRGKGLEGKSGRQNEAKISLHLINIRSCHPPPTHRHLWPGGHWSPAKVCGCTYVYVAGFMWCDGWLGLGMSLD